MADTPTNPTPSPAPAKRAQARRKTTATDRSTAAKKAAATRARNQTVSAAKQTATAAKGSRAAEDTRREVDRTPVERYVDYADRVVSIQIGAALAARDGVVSTVGGLATKYSSRDKVERELRARQGRFETDLRKLERRGTTARARFERDLRARRDRVERDLRGVRRDAEAQAGLVGARVENLVQTGLTAGTQAAAKLTERVARVA